MGNTRARLDLSDNEQDFDLGDDIAALAGKSAPSKDNIDPEKIKEVSTKSGFPSRSGKSTAPVKQPRRRRKKSPYTEQLGVRVRPAVKDVYYELSDQIGGLDQETFEKAVLALIEKQGTKELLDKYNKAIR